MKEEEEDDADLICVFCGDVDNSPFTRFTRSKIIINDASL
jgi:hypothetical protein